MADKSWDDQYISKTDAIKLAIISIAPFANADNINGIQNSFEKTIGDFPSADVAEVKHGEWKWRNGGECSECGFHNSNFDYNFCPNCGSYNGGEHGT